MNRLYFSQKKPVCVDIIGPLDKYSTIDNNNPILDEYNPVSDDKRGIVYNKIVAYLTKLGIIYDPILQDFSKLDIYGTYSKYEEVLIKGEIQTLVRISLPFYNLKSGEYVSIMENLKNFSNTYTLREKFDNFLGTELGIDYDLSHDDIEKGHCLVPLLNGIFNPCLESENGLYPFSLLPHCGYFYPIVNPHPYDLYFEPIAESELYSCPESEDFLKILGDRASLNFFLTWSGAVLFSNPFRLQSLVMLYGPGGTGKTSLANCLASILGDSTDTPSIRDLITPRGRASMIGKRLAIVSETESSYDKALISALKDLSGGIPIGVDPKFKHPFRINPPALLFTGNVFPDVDSSDSGFKRRMCILDCSAILENDIDWIKLMSDNQHKNWLFNASYYAWMNNGNKPLENLKSQPMRDMESRFYLYNSFMSWINDYFCTVDNQSVRDLLDGRSLRDLHDEYSYHVKDYLNGKPLGKIAFSEKIQTNYRMKLVKSNDQRIFKKR